MAPMSLGLGLGLTRQHTAIGGGTFDPTSLSGLQLWADPTDAATVTLDGSSLVSQVADQSGNNNHWTQTSAGNRAGYAGSAPNGANVLTLNGSGQWINWLFNVNQPCTIITSFKNSAIGAYVFDGFGGRLALAFINAAASSNSDHLSAYAGAGLGNDGIAASTNIPIVASVVFNGASSKLRRNGVQIASGNVGPNNDTAGLAFGHSFADVNGWIGPTIICAGVMADADIVSGENLIAGKLGITF